MAICRILALTAAAVAGFQDDAEFGRLIADLIHADPGTRAKAEQALLKAGPKALPALKAAFESKNPEIVARAKTVAAEIERIEFEKQYDASQRPRRLEIVTLQLKDAPLSEALKVLGGQVDSTFHTTIDPKQKLTIDVKDVPVRKCLDQMEDLLKATIVSKYTWHKVVAGPATRKKRAYLPGVTFEFSLVPFKAEGRPGGWILQGEQMGTAAIGVDSFEVADRQKTAVPIERCGRCGLRFTLLKTEDKGPFTVRLKGRLVWESPYALQVADPAKPQDFKVGTFAIKYEWPKVTWTAAEPVPEPLAGRAELEGKLKKQFQPKGPPTAMGVSSVPPEPRPAHAWCACVAGPTPMPPKNAARANGGSYTENAYRNRKPDQFDSLKVRFFKGIEEAFETEIQVAPD
jgi:hypothetical protein